jgi:hypothetical protein
MPSQQHAQVLAWLRASGILPLPAETRRHAKLIAQHLLTNHTLRCTLFTPHTHTLMRTPPAKLSSLSAKLQSTPTQVTTLHLHHSIHHNLFSQLHAWPLQSETCRYVCVHQQMYNRTFSSWHMLAQHIVALKPHHKDCCLSAVNPQ